MTPLAQQCALAAATAIAALTLAGCSSGNDANLPDAAATRLTSAPTLTALPTPRPATGEPQTATPPARETAPGSDATSVLGADLTDWLGTGCRLERDRGDGDSQQALASCNQQPDLDRLAAAAAGDGWTVDYRGGSDRLAMSLQDARIHVYSAADDLLGWVVIAAATTGS